MNIEEMVARAGPDCRDCGARVQRVEMSWTLPDDDRPWHVRMWMVCAAGCRVRVEEFPGG